MSGFDFPLPGRLALIAPASAIADDVLEATLAALQAAGIDYHLGRHARARHRYLAGTVEQRHDDLYEAFADPQVSAVWCLRGGYGCAQLLPGLDWVRLRQASPRPLIGFSDISILLDAFHRHGLPAIHGPVATVLGQSPLADAAEQAARQASLASLGQLLAGHRCELPARHLAGPTHAVRGPLVGGNLTALASVAGTVARMQAPDGAILLLEDVGEPYYRLERSLWQLLDSLDAERLGAVCLGTFNDCPRKGVVHSLEEIVGEYLRPLGVPLYDGLPSGHTALNLAWPYGRTVTLEDGVLRG
ncbi:LD-carboxypeptidase [Pseudomonas sp. RIT-PI-AD]|uniref:S66 peptidase family protein n=1 Tax=Pseudomonas sp. RIT-PI-AD TaxID=3035294 RepID=UPI0021D89575|nr:LD-carboxypeptidase [Pseudomonas sp. RIT-PI-AD]